MAVTRRDASPFAVCMAFDAFRIALGMAPRNFTRIEVLNWLQTQAEAQS